MIEYKRTKYGFSLPEALMTLLIVSIVAVASVPVILKKYEKKQLEVHGIWECDMTESPYKQIRRTKEGNIITSESVSSCTFSPPAGATDFHVDICGNNASAGFCSYQDASHVYMYYPTLRTVSDIKISGNKVLFGGDDLVYAVYKGGGARVMVIY